MSRAAVSKSRADKGAKPGPPAHTPVVAHEIVPGKFNDQDWTFMVEKDGSEEFVEDIIDELVDNTLDVIYDNYIGHQLLPFTVTMAKDAILQIIEWQFLSRDEGEQDVETDPGWMQDEEPDPAVTDCWAQGSVPKAIIPERPMTPVEEELEEKVEETAVIEEAEEEKVEEEEPPELADKVSDTEEGVNQEEEQNAKEEEKNKKKRTKYKPYTGRVKAGKGLNQMTESLEQTEMAMMYEEYVKSQEYEAAEKASGLLNMPVSCHSILKVQAGRPPGNKDVMYDDMGNVLAVIKLNPEKLPSHRVKVKYQVVDPAVEAAQARLEAMRHGRYTSRAIQRRIKRNKVEEIKADEGNRYRVWKYEDLLAIEMCQSPMNRNYVAASTHPNYRETNYINVPCANQNLMNRNYGAESTHPNYRETNYITVPCANQNLMNRNYGAESTHPNYREKNYTSVPFASQTVHLASGVDSIPHGAGLKLDKNRQEECQIHALGSPISPVNHTGDSDSYSIHDLVSMIIHLQADVKRLHTKLDEMRNVPNEKPEMVECGTQTSQSDTSKDLFKTYAQVVSQSSVAVRQGTKSSHTLKPSSNIFSSSPPSPSLVSKEVTSHSTPQVTKTPNPQKAVGDEGRSQCCTLLVGSSILRLVERKRLQLNMDVRTYRGARINTIREKLKTLTMTNYHRIIIHVGGDDISDNHSEKIIQNDFNELTSYIKSLNPKIQIVYVAITPRTDCDVIPTNRTLQQMCNEHQILFIPSYSVFVDKDNYQKNGLFSKDGIHLTKYGTALFLKNIDRCVSPGILCTNDSNSSNCEAVS